MKTHPDKVLELLKTKKPRASKKLDILHSVCREIFNSPGESGFKDFSKGTVGRKSQERNGPSLNTMYAPLGAHFRELLAAWVEWDGSGNKKVTKKPNGQSSTVEEMLRKIPDLAVRSYLSFELCNGKRALAELNTLKGQTTLSVDARPLDGSSLVRNQRESAVIAPSSMLLPAEREALNQACDEDHWKKLGFTISPEGAIKFIGKRGVAEVIHHVGFLVGLRKLLG